MERHDNSSLVIPGMAADEIDYDAAQDMAVAAMFRLMLKDYDNQLDLVFARPGAEFLKGGYWHIVRRNPEPYPASFWEISEPDGSYCAPREEHFRRLQEMDAATNPTFYEDYRKRRAAAVAAGEKLEEEKHREFREKLLDRMNHLYRPQVHISGAMKDAIARTTQKGVILPTSVDRTEYTQAQIADSLQKVGGDTSPPPPPNRAERRAKPKSGKPILPR